MFTDLVVRNYRVVADATLDLSPFTVLIGPNGSGKSTLMEALLRMANAHRQPGNFGQYMGDMPVSGYTALGVGIKPWHAVGMRVDSQVRFGYFQGVPVPGPQIADAKPPTGAWTANHVIHLVINPEFAKRPAPANQPVQQMSRDGSGLAAFVAYLKLAEDDRFTALNAAIADIVPNILRVGVDSASQPGQYVLEVQTRTHGRVQAQHLSDGTIFAICLITALEMTLDKPALVVIDDIDHGLHPKAQRELMKHIRAIQKRMPQIQIVATCHSPYFLDGCEADEIRVVALGADGHTRIKPLTAHSDYMGTKDALSLGEFWSSVGEDWVAKD